MSFVGNLESRVPLLGKGRVIRGAEPCRIHQLLPARLVAWTGLEHARQRGADLVGIAVANETDVHGNAWLRISGENGAILGIAPVTC